MKQLYRQLIKTPAFIGLFLCVGHSACSDYAQKNVEKMMRGDTLIFTQEGTNVTIHYSDSGLLKATLFAPQLIGYKKEGNDIVRMPKGVKAEFYNEEGVKESFLTADKGISYQTKKITEVTQNVVVMNNKGERLNTEKLIWDQKRQLIYTDKFVKITTPTEVLTGEGMESKQDFTDWKIRKPRGRFKLEDGDTTKQK
jgi:LPS export ABC transporter protein LptC